jgi:hypothetical protein
MTKRLPLRLAATQRQLGHDLHLLTQFIQLALQVFRRLGSDGQSM